MQWVDVLTDCHGTVDLSLTCCYHMAVIVGV